MLTYTDHQGRKQTVTNPEAWAIRREEILNNMQKVMGSLPDASRKVPLAMEILESEDMETLVRHKITYASEAGHRVPAYLLIPKHIKKPVPALVCLHGTGGGKGRTAGVGQPYSLYALEPAQRGYVTLAPDYITLGDNLADPIKMGYASGTMKGIYDHMRGVDLLLSMPEVDGVRIGCMGLSLGGHNALFLAAFDTRMKAVVTSSGFDSFYDYMDGDLTGWCQDRYMPRIRDVYGKDPAQLPFDFPDVIAAIAPRPLFVHAPKQDSNFKVDSVQKCLRMAQPVYDLLGAQGHVEAIYPEGGHGFPLEARQEAYGFLDRVLGS